MHCCSHFTSRLCSPRALGACAIVGLACDAGAGAVANDGTRQLGTLLRPASDAHSAWRPRASEIAREARRRGIFARVVAAGTSDPKDSALPSLLWNGSSHGHDGQVRIHASTAATPASSTTREASFGMRRSSSERMRETMTERDGIARCDDACVGDVERRARLRLAAAGPSSRAACRRADRDRPRCPSRFLRDDTSSSSRAGSCARASRPSQAAAHRADTRGARSSTSRTCRRERWCAMNDGFVPPASPTGVARTSILVATFAGVLVATALFLFLDLFLAGVDRRESDAHAASEYADGLVLLAAGHAEDAGARFGAAVAIDRRNVNYALALGEAILRPGPDHRSRGDVEGAARSGGE